MSCHSSCDSCSGELFNECLSCPPGMVISKGICLCTYAWQNLCVGGNFCFMQKRISGLLSKLSQCWSKWLWSLLCSSTLSGLGFPSLTGAGADSMHFLSLSITKCSIYSTRRNRCSDRWLYLMVLFLSVTEWWICPPVIFFQQWLCLSSWLFC